jgi:hypothetical protein
MSYVNLMANDVWTEADIQNRGRALVASQVSEVRQNELRTILLGHLAGMRTATAEELAEITMVKDATEATAVTNAAARADMALLFDARALELAHWRLTLPPVTQPATVTVYSAQGVASVIDNPAIEDDAQARSAAQALIDGATQEALDLYALRNPPPPEPVEDLP